MVNPVNGSGQLPGAASSFELQSYIELVFTQVANNVMVGQMQSLEHSLSYTQNAASALTTLQNLHNQVAIIPKGAFPKGVVSAGSNPGAYRTTASAYFGTPVKIKPAYGSGGVSAFIKQMAGVKALISGMIPGLSAVTPGSGSDPTSLLYTLKVVLANINSSKAYLTASGASAWLVDKQDASGVSSVVSAGLYQQHITNAITAAQSLNTTQTEAVRNYLYIYQEYYQAAASILQQMTQIIQKMAGNAS